MKLQNFLLVCTLLVSSAKSPLLRAQCNATVWKVTGDWKPTEYMGQKSTDSASECPSTCQPGTQLRFLNCIQENSCVEGKVSGGSSLVVLFAGANRAYYTCDTDYADKECAAKPAQGFCIRRIKPSNEPTYRERFLAAVMPLLQESPLRFITPVSRGVEPELTDSVVTIEGGDVDLAPVFKEMDSGTYRIRVEPLSVSRDASRTMQLLWSGRGPATVSASGIQPGLYRLVRLTTNDEPSRLDAWILVSYPDRFAKDSAAFQAAVGSTKKWSHDADVRAPRAALRAYLELLARQAQHEK